MFHRFAFVLCTAAILVLPATAWGAGNVKCTITFDLSGWSAFYKTADGNGRITCDNGQSASVTVRTRGGGFSFGTSSVEGAEGRFSAVHTIDDLYGTYVSAAGHAGASGSVESAAMTKGDASLSFSGKGEGWNLGFAFSGFTIRPR